MPVPVSPGAAGRDGVGRPQMIAEPCRVTQVVQKCLAAQAQSGLTAEKEEETVLKPKLVCLTLLLKI